MIVITVAVFTNLGSQAALAASIQNTTNGAGTRTFFTCRQAEANPGAASTYGAYALAAGNGTSEADFSGNSRTGTYLRAPATTTSVGCIRDTPVVATTFAGNQCFFIPGRLTGSNTFSLEAWFKTSTTSNGKIIGFGDALNSASDTTYDRHIYLDSTGRIVFGVYPNAVNIAATPAGKSYADGAWHQVVAVLSPAGMQLYVDGALAATNTPITTAQAYSGYWKIGCGNLAGWANGDGTTYNGPSYFTGSIQYAAIYTNALTAAQIAAHYNAGK